MLHYLAPRGFHRIFVGFEFEWVEPRILTHCTHYSVHLLSVFRVQMSAKSPFTSLNCASLWHVLHALSVCMMYILCGYKLFAPWHEQRWIFLISAYFVAIWLNIVHEEGSVNTNISSSFILRVSWSCCGFFFSLPHFSCAHTNVKQL